MMHIIIDAYNFLKSVKQVKSVCYSDYNWFIKVMKAYALLRHHTITMVFDGYFPYSANEFFSSSYAIQIIWSESISADEYIEQMMNMVVADNTLLVSSDRALAKNIIEYGIPSVDVFVFYNIIKKYFEQKKIKNNTKPIIVKTATSSDQLNDALMEQAADQSDTKTYDDVAQPSWQYSSDYHNLNLKKHDRKVLKAIKKL